MLRQCDLHLQDLDYIQQMLMETRRSRVENKGSGQEACTQAGDVRERDHTHALTHTNTSHTPDPKEASSSKNKDGLGIELEPIRGKEFEESARLSPWLARKYSATQYIGPATTCAIKSRRRHPHEDMRQESLLAGEEQDSIAGGTGSAYAILKRHVSNRTILVCLYICVCLYTCQHAPVYMSSIYRH